MPEFNNKMLHKKQGKPEEGDLVLCTVTKVQHNSVFAKLDEYANAVGMIHISEVSPGRIRNIRDYVKEGKVIVCKVLKIHERTGHIDLSLRRVSDSMRRSKVEEIKQEQKSEKIVEFLAKQLNMNVAQLYNEIASKIFKNYDSLYTCFQDVSKDALTLNELGIDKRIAEKLTELIKQRIRPPEVSIRGKLSLVCYDPKGIETIKEAFKRVKDKSISVRYTKAGEYRIDIRASDFKDAEERLKKDVDAVMEFIESHNGEASFMKEEGKKERA